MDRETASLLRGSLAGLLGLMDGSVDDERVERLIGPLARAVHAFDPGWVRAVLHERDIDRSDANDVLAALLGNAVDEAAPDNPEEPEGGTSQVPTGSGTRGDETASGGRRLAGLSRLAGHAHP